VWLHIEEDEEARLMRLDQRLSRYNALLESLSPRFAAGEDLSDDDGYKEFWMLERLLGIKPIRSITEEVQNG